MSATSHDILVAGDSEGAPDTHGANVVYTSVSRYGSIANAHPWRVDNRVFVKRIDGRETELGGKAGAQTLESCRVLG